MKNFFYFNSSNRKAIIILTITIVIIHFVSKVSDERSIEQYDFTQYQQEVKSLKIKKKFKKQSKKNPFKNKYFRKKDKTTENKHIEIDINLADTLAFEQLPGIGTYFAKRICKFRNLLGGFYSTSQILEVYQMDSIRYNKIEKNLVVYSKDIQKKNINKLDEYQLRKHPYISFNLARLIVNYRNEHGEFEDIEDLYELHLIDSLKFRKIAYYFTANEFNNFRGEN